MIISNLFISKTKPFRSTVAPVITDFSVPHTVKIGSSFLLKCMGTGNPKPIVRWQQNKTNVVIDGLRITGNVENLTVHNAGSQDSGIYVCRLSNFLGSSNQNQSLLVQGNFLSFYSGYFSLE